jgi:hypothetical protein
MQLKEKESLVTKEVQNAGDILVLSDLVEKLSLEKEELETKNQH